MSTDRVVLLRCDVGDCRQQVLGHPGETIAAVRDRADLQHRWTRQRTRDHCSIHSD